MRVILHPKVSAPLRRAPLATLAKVVRRLARDRGWRLLVTGGAGEGALVAPLATLPGAVAAGETNLPELAALIVRAPVLVTMNIGPAHLAAALGTPVVDLYALTNLQHAPWRGRGLFRGGLCRVCLKSVCFEGHHRCLAGIEVGSVVAAVREAPAGWAPAIPEDPAALFGTTGLGRGVDEARDLLTLAR
ncbi:glycosyltransferase family 9 protein [uncultured Jannaschia sp.]|uniref:glycosyltransferase family 9 protein n=1 Tax=uncultured Jannaschia sp. TaxID=293347 RepID=UPI00261BB519|nr:glycosyltransferase family 9 protein [uncultured Jannaschia sp.]